MTQYTLMLIEATGIQEYIFGSNQLAQNIGASELVQQATTDWIYAQLPHPHNVDGTEIADRSLGAGGLAAEVIYAGGGNAAILFANDGQALEFARGLTRHALGKAPGLQLVLKRKSFDSEQDVLATCHRELRGKLAQRKLNRDFSTPLLGLGVTAACVYTGAPAVGVEKQEGRLISAEVKAKLDARPDGEKRLNNKLPQVRQAGYEFVYDFNTFGTPGESSYLAVIHTDGNGMGKRIKEIGEQHITSADNGNYVLALRRFSKSVQVAAEQALIETVNLLLVSHDEATGKFGGKVPTPTHDGHKYLPFRPIVFGGDDVTFVCEGRLGLALATKYLDEFSRQMLDDGKPAHARAGVAVVKSHYPFSRAYQLADDLCKFAKGYIRHWEGEGEHGLTALDWHFAVSGLVLPLGEVREREYKAKARSLLMRPLRLSNPQGDWRSWKTFTSVMAEFQDESEKGKWAGRRNKIKALRDALRDGREAVRQFLQVYHLELPNIPDRLDMKAQGWQGGDCGYFDVIEALDFYVPLNGGQPQ